MIISCLNLNLIRIKLMCIVEFKIDNSFFNRKCAFGEIGDVIIIQMYLLLVVGVSWGVLFEGTFYSQLQSKFAQMFLALL